MLCIQKKEKEKSIIKQILNSSTAKCKLALVGGINLTPL